MSDTRLSAKQAAEILGKSTRYIQKQIQAGTLSATRVEGRKYVIDRSELFRVFPDAHTVRTTTNPTNEQRETPENNENSKVIAILKSQNEFLRDLLAAANTEKSQMMSVLEKTQKLLEAPKSKRKKLFGIF